MHAHGIVQNCADHGPSEADNNHFPSPPGPDDTTKAETAPHGRVCPWHARTPVHFLMSSPSRSSSHLHYSSGLRWRQGGRATGRSFKSLPRSQIHMGESQRALVQGSPSYCYPGRPNPSHPSNVAWGPCPSSRMRLDYVQPPCPRFPSFHCPFPPFRPSSSIPSPSHPVRTAHSLGLTAPSETGSSSLSPSQLPARVESTSCVCSFIRSFPTTHNHDKLLTFALVHDCELVMRS